MVCLALGACSGGGGGNDDAEADGRAEQPSDTGETAESGSTGATNESPACQLLTTDEVGELFGQPATVAPAERDVPVAGGSDSCLWEASVDDERSPTIYQLQLSVFTGRGALIPAPGARPRRPSTDWATRRSSCAAGTLGTTAGYRAGDRSVFLSYAIPLGEDAPTVLPRPTKLSSCSGPWAPASPDPRLGTPTAEAVVLPGWHLPGAVGPPVRPPAHHTYGVPLRAGPCRRVPSRGTAAGGYPVRSVALVDEPAPARGIGRARELATLAFARESARTGRGSMLVVSGAPGIGKTWLCETAAQAARDEGFQTGWGAGWPDGDVPSLWPWRQALRAFGSAALAAALEAWAEPDASGDERWFQRFVGIVDALHDSTRDRPALVVIDDLHAADPPTVQLARFVARHGRGLHTVVVVAHRPVDASAFEALQREGSLCPCPASPPRRWQRSWPP